MTKIPKKKILLAEDDSSMRRFIEVILRKADYDVLIAEDGLAAMQILFETEVDAVITDAIMPNLSGFDLCRMLRGDEQRNKIPLIILSGLTEQPPDNFDQLADVFLIKDADLKKQIIQTLQLLIPQSAEVQK